MKLSRASVIAALPEGWQLKLCEGAVIYFHGAFGIEYNFIDDKIEKIQFFKDGELHRDPAEGPALTWCVGDHIYEKYFLDGLPVKNTGGSYGVVKNKDGTIILTY